MTRVGILTLLASITLSGSAAAARPATPSERAAIRMAVERFACGTCDGWTFQWGRTAVSKIDAHFGVATVTGGTNPQGELQSAVAVVFKVGQRWRTLELGQSNVGCDQMPRVVRTDLRLSCHP